MGATEITSDLAGHAEKSTASLLRLLPAHVTRLRPAGLSGQGPGQSCSTSPASSSHISFELGKGELQAVLLTGRGREQHRFPAFITMAGPRHGQPSHFIFCLFSNILSVQGNVPLELALLLSGSTGLGREGTVRRPTSSRDSQLPH